MSSPNQLLLDDESQKIPIRDYRSPTSSRSGGSIRDNESPTPLDDDDKDSINVVETKGLSRNSPIDLETNNNNLSLSSGSLPSSTTSTTSSIYTYNSNQNPILSFSEGWVHLKILFFFDKIVNNQKCLCCRDIHFIMKEFIDCGRLFVKATKKIIIFRNVINTLAVEQVIVFVLFILLFF